MALPILIGSDPELFVFDGEEPISAWGMSEGTKEKPVAVKHKTIQVDGMALEYNPNPATTLAQWERNHKSVQKDMLSSIPKGLSLEAVPTAFFAEEVFNTSPAEALELGCMPDFNAYTGDINPKPNGDAKFRTGAGHIHIGWGENFEIDDFHMKECCALVKALDMYLGLPSVIMDGDDKRRELYGKAGAFRPKSYGLEYRTLSNFWVKTPSLRKWAFNETIRAIRNAQDPDFYYLDTSRNIINDNKTYDANYYANLYNLNIGE